MQDKSAVSDGFTLRVAASFNISFEGTSREKPRSPVNSNVGPKNRRGYGHAHIDT